jgi:hypothetical protein
MSLLVFRIAKVSLSLALGGFAAWLLVSQIPESAQSPNGSQSIDIASLRKALTGNAVSPYRPNLLPPRAGPRTQPADLYPVRSSLTGERGHPRGQHSIRRDIEVEVHEAVQQDG